MAWVGQGIAFAGLCGAAAWLEINGRPAGGLWFLIVLWAVFADWHPGRGNG